MKITKETLNYVHEQLQGGASMRSIARTLGIHHSTVAYWLKQQRAPKPSLSLPQEPYIAPTAFATWYSYSYILGLYLGDGHISKVRRSYRLRITQDMRYPTLIALNIHHLGLLLPHSSPSAYPCSDGNCTNVTVYAKILPLLFPQAGKNRKDQREIVLAQWQQSHLQINGFIRGLIHSDGSRYKNRVRNAKTGREYSYTTYQFSSKSQEIMGLMMHSLESIGVNFRHRTKRDVESITISQRADVALLDQIGCQKS